MAVRCLFLFVVILTMIDLGSSDPRFTFLQDRLAKKEQDAIFTLFQKHWRPEMKDVVFEEHLTRIVYSPAISKEGLPPRMVEVLRAFDNNERLEFVREVHELMEYKQQLRKGNKEQIIET